MNTTLKTKDKWLQIVISIRRNQRQRAVQWSRGGKCLIKLSCKGYGGPKAAKSQGKRILGRGNSNGTCKGLEVGKNLFNKPKTPVAEVNDQRGDT